MHVDGSARKPGLLSMAQAQVSGHADTVLMHGRCNETINSTAVISAAKAPNGEGLSTADMTRSTRQALPKPGALQAGVETLDGAADAVREAGEELERMCQGDLNVAGLAADHGDLIAEEDQEDEAKAVETMLSRIIAKRKEGTKAKQERLVQDALAKLTSSAESLKTAVAKDAKDSTSSARTAVGKVEKHMQATMKEMEQCTEKYQQEMHALWKKYGEQYEQLGQVKQEAKAAAERRKTAAKRKISALQTEAKTMVAETEERLNAMRQKSTKLPGVLQVLQSLMDSAA